jgi:hypothetical protein
MTLDPELVGLIHDYILGNEPGIHGSNRGALEGALGRIEARRHYEGLHDIFEIAGLYAERSPADIPSPMRISGQRSCPLWFTCFLKGSRWNGRPL